MKTFNLAVVGATGLVGREMLKILEEREFPVSNVFLFASKRSEGEKLEFCGELLPVHKLQRSSFRNIDIALFSIGSELSKKFTPYAVESGAIVIDNSNAFRLDSHVPLVVPEVNPKEIIKHKGIIANPNCSTIQLVVALQPIYDLVGIERVIVSTYQAVSGAGWQAIDELEEQSKAYFQKQKLERRIFPHQIAFNAIPHIDVFEDNGFTKEEMKLFHETKKIFKDDKINICATAVRIPVFHGHSESVYLETKKYLSVEKLKEIYLQTKNIKLVDDIQNAKYPLAIMSETYDAVMVGRIRKALDTDNGIHLWVVANNLRKGAALNAVQIAEELITL